MPDLTVRELEKFVSYAKFDSRTTDVSSSFSFFVGKFGWDAAALESRREAFQAAWDKLQSTVDASEEEVVFVSNTVKSSKAGKISSPSPVPASVSVSVSAPAENDEVSLLSMISSTEP